MDGQRGSANNQTDGHLTTGSFAFPSIMGELLKILLSKRPCLCPCVSWKQKFPFSIKEDKISRILARPNKPPETNSSQNPIISNLVVENFILAL